MGLSDKVRTVFAAASRDEASRYVLAERAARRLHPEAILSEKDRSWLRDTEFRAAYERLDPYNLRRLDRAWNLKEFARHALDVPGDTAECGVYQGLTSYFICKMTQGAGKVHHAFDSFEGVSPPNAVDGDYWKAGDLATPEDFARDALSEFPSVEFHVGWIPVHFSRVEARPFSLVHVDVDLYQPTLDALNFFLPRMSPRGVVLIDDYGFATCPGARAATDEACAVSGHHIVELSSGQALILT